MTQLNTNNPFALRYLMDDTLFAFEFDAPINLDQPTRTTHLSFSHLGANKNRILYLIENEAENYFSPAALDAFSKTLNALGLSLEDVAVLNLGQVKEDLVFEDLCAFFNPHKVIFAGASPIKMGVKDLAMNVASTQETVKLLYTYSFEEMLLDTTKKKLFWQAVKTL